MNVLCISQKKRITQEAWIKLKLTEYPAALLEFLTRATQKPKAELAAEILGQSWQDQHREWQNNIGRISLGLVSSLFEGIQAHHIAVSVDADYADNCEAGPAPNKEAKP